MNERIVLNSDTKVDKVVKLLKNPSTLSDDDKKKGRKFVLKSKSEMIISEKFGDNQPRHNELGEYKEVITAGWVIVKNDAKGKLEKIVLNNKSKDYWPTSESSKEATKFITDLLDSLNLDYLKIVSEKVTEKGYVATHIVTEEAPFYKDPPQPDSQPEGNLSKGEEVITLDKNNPKHPKVKRRGGKKVYVSSEILAKI